MPEPVAVKAMADAQSPPLWLGVDLSTQSLTLVLLPDQPVSDEIYYLDSVRYAIDLPQYGTEHGMHIADGDDGEKVCYYLAHTCTLHQCHPDLVFFSAWMHIRVWYVCQL